MMIIIRLKPERRKLYCQMIISLFEGDLLSASSHLQALGYLTNQSHRAPERDAQFFEYLLRNVDPSPSTSSTSSSSAADQQAYSNLRNQQRMEDETAGVRETNGRNIAALPEDFLYLTRVIGLLRGLTVRLECSCPILYILAMHAKLGLDKS